MVRLKDPFWNYVEVTNDGSMNCKFCGRLFGKGTSISRIKWHLSGEKRRNVIICGSVSKEVQKAALLALHGGNIRHKSIANSSNVHDCAVLTCPEEQNTEIESTGGDTGRVQSLIRVDQVLDNGLECAFVFPMEDDTQNGTGGVAQPGAGASSSVVLHYITGETRGNPLPTSSPQLVDLGFNFDQLDSALQQCLLYCALFPEDHKIERVKLIGYLIDEGIIEGMRSRQAEFDEGHTMLDKLENVCFWRDKRENLCFLRSCFTDDGKRAVKMHDLIRNYAIQTQQENSQVIVKANAQVKEFSDIEEWTENLTRVSLVHNQIEQIPSKHSPSCPRLSTLLLSNNLDLEFIASSFFKQLRGLKVLDLSHTRIETLPASVSDLVSLTTLLLIGCVELRNVSSLEKLKALKRLDLSGTRLGRMVQGMECLSNLRYVRMNGCGEKKFPSRILPQLSHLQVFVLENYMPNMYKDIYAPVKGKEVGCLKKLETLECHFEGHDDFMEFFSSRDQTQALSTYKIFVGHFHQHDYLEMMEISSRSKIVGLGNFSMKRDGDFQLVFPNDLQQLMIFYCNDIRSLCDIFSKIKYATDLEVIHISRSNTMESLVSSWFISGPLQSLSCNDIFSVLKEITCSGCKSMKNLFPRALLPNLVKLEKIRVFECEKMEEIIETRSDEESSSIEFSLPNLRVLTLKALPVLKIICTAKLICNSIEKIIVMDCQKLKRMSICLLLLENGRPSPLPSLKTMIIYPKGWWQSVVEWDDHPNAKDVLRGVVEFL